MSQANLFFYEVKDVFFADEGDTLAVGSTDLSTGMNVRCLVDNKQVAAFELEPFNGLAIIPIGDIIKTIDGHNGGYAHTLKITVTQGSSSAETISTCMLCRRFGHDSMASLFSSWLSSGPLERETFQGAPETLSFISSREALSQKAMIQIEAEDGTVTAKTFCSLKDKDLEAIDVSPDTVLAFARSQMISSKIKGYSVWIEYVDDAGNLSTGTPIKFRILRDRLERVTYKFLGARGTYEYIHASGDLERSIDTTTGTFTYSGIEKELSNDATITREQNSGHIATPAAAEFWLDFLASKERYVVDADGNERLIIIEESNPAVIDFKIGEIAFRWHYSNKYNTIFSRVSIPLESLDISGEERLDDSSNQLQLGIIYNPSNTTKRGVIWELVSGSEYASLGANGLLTAKEGADESVVVVKATSTHYVDIFATKSILVSYHNEAVVAHGLTVTTNVDSPVIRLSINGESYEYSPGILIDEGKSVTLNVSAEGYSAQSRTFIMSISEKDQYFELLQSIEATITPVFAEITQPAQNLQYTISDPSNHGWTLDWNGPDSYDQITGGGVISGNATYHRGSITGTGSAVVYLSIPANSNRATRSIATSPFRFEDNNTGTRTGLTINQLGTSDAATLVTGVSLNKTDLSLNTGSSETLIASVSPSNATNKNLTWSSSNPSVAQVGQDGTVYGIAAGACTITAYATDGSNKYASCAVSVAKSDIAVAGVSLNKSSLDVGIGLTGQLTATVLPSNATNKSVTWRSTAPSIATVDDGGLVTGIKKGACRVYVKTVDGSYEAYCSINVTANGTMSADDISIKSLANSAAAALRTTNMRTGTISASSTASWLSNFRIDTSSYPYYVRMDVQQNTLTAERQATVTITGTDQAGDPVETTFTVFQNGRTSSDIPCLGMDMSGPEAIYNSDNLADYSITFDPAGTTQGKVVWSVTDRSGNTTPYATIETEQDDRCTIKVLSGADATPLLVKAVNYYNGQLIATKEITATYFGGSSAEGHIEISESYIEVAASSTEDDWAEVTLVDMSTPINQLQITRAGFITSAMIDSRGHLKIGFSANSGDLARSGSVTLSGTNNQGHVVTAVVSYLQRGQSKETYGFEVRALQVLSTTAAKMAVIYRNDTYDEVVIRNQYWSIIGYDSLGSIVFHSNGSLNDKTVAALSEEETDYDLDIEITGPCARYIVTLSSDTMTSEYRGEGDDPI